jgi:hypothetical protein
VCFGDQSHKIKKEKKENKKGKIKHPIHYLITLLGE